MIMEVGCPNQGWHGLLCAKEKTPSNMMANIYEIDENKRFFIQLPNEKIIMGFDNTHIEMGAPVKYGLACLGK